MQLPKWECIWESLGSIPCTLPHLWERVSHLNTLSWPHTPLHSTFNCKPNVKVVTIYVSITSCFLVSAHLPYLELGHDPPLCTVDRTIGYIILWPWKLTTKFYLTLLQFVTYRSYNRSCFVHFCTCRSCSACAYILCIFQLPRHINIFQVVKLCMWCIFRCCIWVHVKIWMFFQSRDYMSL